jgi:ubiquitin related modifier 1
LRRGGLELLIKDKKKHHEVEFDGFNSKTLKEVVLWVKENLIAERAELFVVEGSMYAGALPPFQS